MKLRDELAEQYYERTGFCPTEYAVMNFHAGFDACEAQYLPMLEKLECALGEIEAASQDYDSYRSIESKCKIALAELENFKRVMNGDEK